MGLAGRSLVALSDLSKQDIITTLDVADDMASAIGLEEPAERSPAGPLDRILGSLFFEPSTRTRLSFASAMLRLGGQVLGFADPSASSVKKGESLADTVRVVSSYCDIIVIRHPLAGAAKVAAEAASVPVMNAGDGPHEHPTQTLTDLFCIRRNKHTLSGLRVGLCGDLKFGRTVHSLAPIMARFGSDLVCIAPTELQMPRRWLDEVEGISGRRPRQTNSLEEAIAELDVLYMTRIQRERFDRLRDYEQLKGIYVLTDKLLGQAAEDLVVMHPLPRVDEIAKAIDDDSRAKYFRQAAGGVPVRMALIALLLDMVEAGRPRFGLQMAGLRQTQAAAESGEASGPERQDSLIVSGPQCANPKCITRQEDVEALFYDEPDGLRCIYCEEMNVQKTL